MNERLIAFIDLCAKTWPNLYYEIIVTHKLPFGGYKIQVSFNGWLSPVVFDEAALAQPQAMIRTLKDSIPPQVMA